MSERSISGFSRAPIKGEGMISDPDEYEWKCDCAICEERYRHWKNDFDTQQKALRNEALDKKAENARELGLDYEPDYKVTVVDDQHPNGVPLEQWGRPAPVQEPTDIWFEKCFRSDTPAAQRQWTGLTDEEKQEWVEAMPDEPKPRHIMNLINVIEVELKGRNG